MNTAQLACCFISEKYWSKSKLPSHPSRVIDTTQYAYQQKLSNTDAPLKLVDDWTEELDRPDVAFIQNACIDFGKSFDRMQHEILITKIPALGFNYSVVGLIHSFHTNGHQCVGSSKARSQYKPLEKGAPRALS